MEKIKILIADDHPIFRKGLKQVVESDELLEVVSETSDGNETLTEILKLKPQIAILDIEMPLKNGLEVLKALKQRDYTETFIIFLTMYNDSDFFNHAMDEGVAGYVLKENAAEEIILAIKYVAKGKRYVTPCLYEKDFGNSSTANSISNTSFSQLTNTEIKVLKLISNNKTTKQIAQELFVSPKTIENHRTNICQKLDIHGTNALLKFAIENKKKL